MIHNRALFVDSLTKVLKKFDDPEWIGHHSPLASPYFLGMRLQKQSHFESPANRGLLLKKMILEAAQEIKPKRAAVSPSFKESRKEKKIRNHIRRSELFYELLTRQYLSPQSQREKVPDLIKSVGLSKASYYENLEKARYELADALLLKVRPSLRLERPILHSLLIGRDAIVQKIRKNLSDHQSVSLSGSGGIGKTSIAQYICAHQPANKPVFWFTFHPGLNDDITSLMFAIGHFFFMHGAKNLWLQLLAQEGPVNRLFPLIKGLFEQDVLLLSGMGMTPLFCFDEVDLLQKGSHQARHGAHKFVLELIDLLKNVVPTLLIGQRDLFDTKHRYQIAPLTEDDLAAFFEDELRSGLLSVEAAEKFWTISEGNPRVMELLRVLAHEDDSLEQAQLMETVSYRPLFHRLWKRLTEDEKRVLAELSVYRAGAHFKRFEEKEGVDGIYQRGLLRFDRFEGVKLPDFCRQLVYGMVGDTNRKAAHALAARAFLEIGEYTEAVYHLWYADDFESAIRLWFRFRKQEIQHGHASTAYDIFHGDMELPLLPDRVQSDLRTIRNELSLMYGEPMSVLDGGGDYSWHPEPDLFAEQVEQVGRAYQMVGRIDESIDKYGQAIDTLFQHVTHVLYLHRYRGQLLLEQRKMHEAEREILYCQYHQTFLEAMINQTKGRYDEAYEKFLECRDIATELNDEEYIHKADQVCALAAASQKDLPLAQQHIESARKYMETIGNVHEVSRLQAMAAGHYLNVKAFKKALPLLEEARQFFEATKQSTQATYLYSNLAEAYFETGDVENAEFFACKCLENKEVKRAHPYARLTLGRVWQALKNFTEADQQFQVGVDEAAAMKDAFIQAYLVRQWGACYIAFEQAELGIKKLYEAKDIFHALGDDTELADTIHMIDEATGL